MSTQTLTNTWAEVDLVTSLGKDKPFFDAHQPNPEALVITAGTPKSPITATTSVDQNLDPLINGFGISGTSFQYQGLTSRRFELSFAGSISSSTNNHLVYVSGGINGVVLPRSEIVRFVATGTDVGSVSGSFILTLNTNDTVDVFFDSAVSTTLTVERGLYNIKAID